MGSHDLRDLLQFVFIQAHDAHTDQIGDVAVDVVGCVALFQRRAVFAHEFADAFVRVFHAAFHLGDVHLPRTREHAADDVREGCASGQKGWRLLGVKKTKLGLFQIKVE